MSVRVALVHVLRVFDVEGGGGDRGGVAGVSVTYVQRWVGSVTVCVCWVVECEMVV